MDLVKEETYNKLFLIVLHFDEKLKLSVPFSTCEHGKKSFLIKLFLADYLFAFSVCVSVTKLPYDGLTTILNRFWVKHEGF